jgi:hypothetical protein
LHEKNIKKKNFKVGDMVLLYDNKYLQHPGKLRMHWLWPYEVKFVIYGVVVHLNVLEGKEIQRMVNGSRLKLYMDIRPTNPQ